MEYVVSEDKKSEMIEIIQSWVLTSARYDFNVYEKRIVYRIVEMIQFLLQGKKLNQRYRIDKTLFDLYTVEMPISAVLCDEEDTNYQRVKDALIRMSKKDIEYEDERVWKLIPIIGYPEVRKYEGVIRFRLHEDIYNVLMNFSKGFKKYELKTVFEFESVYAMRFYELFSNQRTPLTFSIDELKLMFGLEDKYPHSNNFIQRVIEPAKAVLDRKSPYSFEYSPLKMGKRIVSIKFYPVEIAANVTEEYKEFLNEKAKKQLTPAWMIERQILLYLKEHYRMSTPEIKNNLELFELAQKTIPDLLMFLSEVKAKANRAANPKGYLINSLRKKMGIKITPKTTAKEKKPVA